jgi:hypothetical protein
MSRKIKVILFFIALFGVWVFLAPFLANILIVEKPLEHADAIWVLSGSSTYIERNQEAARAYKTGIAAKIFLTNDGGEAGWSQSEQRNPPFVELAKRELIDQGVPEEAIEILPKLVESTKDEVLKNNLSIEIGLQSPPTGEQTPSPFTWWLSQRGWMIVGEEFVKNLRYWVYY